jgi:FkbH-like protein
VFVDDNPDERELMRQALPQVLTVDLPADPALYRAAVEGLPQVQTLVVTTEDRSRVAQYRSKRERDELKQATGSLDGYLHSLEISAEIAPATAATLARVHQLFQRTNQFNLTTRRYEAGQLATFADDPGWRLYTLRARDRFGDHGLVATALARVAADAWTVDSFLMSCRVIGHGLETALLARICTDARAAGADAVIGEYIESKKNAPARDFYERHGFAPGAANDGVTRFRRALADGGVPAPAWVHEIAFHDA